MGNYSRIFLAEVCPNKKKCCLLGLSFSLEPHISVGVLSQVGGGPRVVVSTAAFHARVRGSVPGLGGLKETK